MNFRKDGIYTGDKASQERLVRELLENGVRKVEPEETLPFMALDGLELRINPILPPNVAAVVSGDRVSWIFFGDATDAKEAE